MPNYDINESLYHQITNAKTSVKFSKAVRWLITSVLYKIKLPVEVREAFINDIAELYYQKFGYRGVTDVPLFDTLAELYMQEDVISISEDGSHVGGIKLNCRKLEYSFDSVRQARTRREYPYKKETPASNVFEYDSPTFIDQLMWDGGVDNKEEVLDVFIAADKANLTDHERDLIWLNGVVGLSVREISDLGAPYPSKSVVATRLREAKNKLIKASQEGKEDYK